MKNCGIKIKVFILLALCLSSCKKPLLTIENDTVISSLYSASEDTLKLRDHKYILETYLYRDFFPGFVLNRNTSLFAPVTLVSIDSSAITGELDIKKLYLIKDKLIWASTPEDLPDPYLPVFKLQKISKNGPEWDTDINVDAIIMIADRITDDKYYIIARKQTIHRVE